MASMSNAPPESAMRGRDLHVTFDDVQRSDDAFQRPPPLQLPDSTPRLKSVRKTPGGSAKHREIRSAYGPNLRFPNSTSKDEFPPHSPGPLSSGPKKAYVPSPVKFEAVSESRDKFRAHAVQPLPNIPVKPYRNTGAKFDDSTTNKAMFKVEPSAYQRLSAPKKAYVPSPVKFESTSEARDKYTAYATEIRTPPIGLWVANDLVEVMVQPGADRPISVSKMFSTTSNGQDEMELKIVEGWSRKASECTLLTVFEIEGIPQSPAGRPQIRVTLSIDAEGSMTVTAVDRDNDVVLAEETVEVTPAYSVSPPKGVHAAGSPSPDKHGERRAGYR